MQPINVEAKRKKALAELYKLTNKKRAKLRAEKAPIVKKELTKTEKSEIVNLDVKNRQKLKFKAYSTLSDIKFSELPRNLKKAIKKAKNVQIAEFDKVFKPSQKVSKKIKSFKPITEKTLAKITAESNKPVVIKPAKTPKGKSLVCITNGTDYKRLTVVEAMPYVNDAGWNFCPKSQYKTWVKLQEARKQYLKPKKLTKEELKEAGKFVNYNSRGFRRSFIRKQGENTFSRETKIKLEEESLTRERLVYKRGKMGEPTIVKKTRKKVEQTIYLPAPEVSLRKVVTEIPKGIKAWTKFKFRTTKLKKEVPVPTENTEKK